MLAYLTLLFLVAVLVATLYTLHKVRRAHIMLYEIQNRSRHDLDDLFHQVEALQGLYVDLELGKSLPSTRGWAASPDFLQQIARHALEKKPEVAVECSSGTSTVVLARCMQLNGLGRVYSLEHDPEYAQATRNQLARHGLTEWATVLDAPLRSHEIKGEVWPWYMEGVLPADCQIDMLTIDGPPMNTRSLARYPAGPILFPRLRAHAAVFLDDSVRHDEKKILETWRDEFPELRQTYRACEKGCAVLLKDALPEDQAIEGFRS
jgi:predicted O-methyltransferase YrrM